MKALSTQGGAGMHDNIANVFGPRTMEALIPIEAPLGDIAHASGLAQSPEPAASEAVTSILERMY